MNTPTITWGGSSTIVDGLFRIKIGDGTTAYNSLPYVYDPTEKNTKILLYSMSSVGDLYTSTMDLWFNLSYIEYKKYKYIKAIVHIAKTEGGDPTYEEAIELDLPEVTDSMVDSATTNSRVSNAGTATGKTSGYSLFPYVVTYYYYSTRHELNFQIPAMNTDAQSTYGAYLSVYPIYLSVS